MSFFDRLIRKISSSGVVLREEREAEESMEKCLRCDTVNLGKKVCEGCLGYFVDDKEDDFLCPSCNSQVEKGRKTCSKCRLEFVEKGEWDLKKSPDRFKRGEDVYRNIKQALQNEGDYNQAGDFYMNEMYLRRKRCWEEKKLFEWAKSFVICSVIGYGERPVRTIISTGLIILLFALIFSILGDIHAGGEEDSDLNFGNYIYFSIVTFTTLGYGDLHPKGCCRYFAAGEAIIGAFMIALFIFVFGRRMMR